ncbi:ABC transporter ATP-binding protein [Anaerocolumna sp.]|uniref:ABC transporter ATP-binding protein n=1 Tax=Anaerocolumna sp. TaxID=2041569 RepID=UPI0028A738FA|nr:ABC transporter ATP-binding protein [Anaerocolumna sp.]
MIDVINVTKKYGKFIANDDLSFKVLPGEISILLGPNGAGKSTIIKSIAGLLRFKGNILICGHKNKSLEAKRLLGYIPEMPVLYDMLTIWEHMEFIARAYSLKNWEAKANELFERLELDDKKNKLGNELSKGMQQKVSICCGLLPGPRVLLFDEPLVGLDPHAIKELKSMLQEYKKDGASILLSTHMLDSVSEFWDSTNIMMNGKFMAGRTRKEVLGTGEDLEKLFFDITESKKDVKRRQENERT